MQKYARTISPCIENETEVAKNGCTSSWTTYNNLQTIASDFYKYVRAVENNFLRVAEQAYNGW